MIWGILAGVTWALGTVTLGYVLAMAPFVSTAQALFLAPFVSTFLHDGCSAVWMLLFNGVRGELPKVGKALRTRSGRFVAVAGLIGGPVGMTGYMLAVNNMGASVGAVASAIFPAIGAILAHIFLKERMQWYRWIFLLCTLAGVFGISAGGSVEIKNVGLGLLGVFMCSFGWGIEAVILAKCLTDPAVKDAYALQIRQTTSALVYGAVLLPILRGWGFTARLFVRDNLLLCGLIALAALFSTGSYLMYYRAIGRIGPSKAMALDVTYSAWAMILTVVIFRDTSAVTPVSVLCCAVVLICSVLAAADFRELLPKRKKDG